MATPVGRRRFNSAQDYALLREFAPAGHGVAPVPNVLEAQFRKESGLAMVGAASKVEAQFYAISMERKIKHPALLAIYEKAGKVFSR